MNSDYLRIEVLCKTDSFSDSKLYFIYHSDYHCSHANEGKSPSFTKSGRLTWKAVGTHAGDGKRGLTSSMIDGGTYFVLMRCSGTRNERSSGTLVESLHSIRRKSAIV